MAMARGGDASKRAMRCSKIEKTNNQPEIAW